MQNYPSVVTLPFQDGARDVPDHIAVLIKQHKIPTHELTYAQTMERLNLANAEKVVKDQFQKIQDAHLRNYGI